MRVKRFVEAAAYEAPHHHDVRSLRLQGFEPEGPRGFWTGLSHILPGGGAGPDATPLEKVYVVLAGSVTVITSEGQTELQPLDSCCIAAGEMREVKNTSNHVATMLVVMPYPEKAP